jgi:3-oxoadipate enol-lactonase
VTAPLVLLHPLGATGAFWDPVVEELGGVEAHTPDLPGHGTGPMPGPRPTLEEYAAGVVAHAAEHGPVDLVGVSLGGLVAQHVAGSRPELVRRLVLVDTVAVYPEPMRQVWRERAAVARERGLGALTAPMAAMWFTDGFQAEHHDVVAATLDRFLAGDAEGYARCCELLEDADVRPLLDAVEAPAMVVCGDQDTPPFREAAEWLAARLPEGRLEWLAGKHAVVLERPKEMAALLADFLG